jgi:hypothetical protein
VRIDPATGCLARSGQANTIFEYFREGHLPDCSTAEDPQDIFNDAGGTDPVSDDKPPAEEPLF